MPVELSIIIPMYNAELYILEAIESALENVGDNVEVIVVDDGSKDNSLNVCKNYCDKRVHVLTQPNSGAPAARNKGLGIAKGEYVQFFDADDFFAKGATVKILDEIHKEKHDCYVGNFYRYDGEKSVLEYKDLSWLRSTYDFYMFTPSPNSKVFRKEILIKHDIKFDNIRLAQDLNFYLKFLGVSQDIKVIDYPFFHYRYVKKSISHVTDDRILDIEKSIKGAISFYDGNGSDSLCYSYAYLDGVKHTNYQLNKLMYVDDKETIVNLYPEMKRIWNEFYSKSKTSNFDTIYVRKKTVDAIIQYYYRIRVLIHLKHIES